MGFELKTVFLTPEQIEETFKTNNLAELQPHVLSSGLGQLNFSIESPIKSEENTTIITLITTLGFNSFFIISFPTIRGSDENSSIKQSLLIFSQSNGTLSKVESYTDLLLNLSPDAIQKLIAVHPDIATKAYLDGNHLIHLAAKLDKEDVLDILLSRKDIKNYLDVTNVDEQHTALFIATEKPHINIITKLINAGAYIHKKCGKQAISTPFLKAYAYFKSVGSSITIRALLGFTEKEEKLTEKEWVLLAVTILKAEPVLFTNLIEKRQDEFFKLAIKYFHNIEDSQPDLLYAMILSCESNFWPGEIFSLIHLSGIRQAVNSLPDSNTFKRQILDCSTSGQALQVLKQSESNAPDTNPDRQALIEVLDLNNNTHLQRLKETLFKLPLIRTYEDSALYSLFTKICSQSIDNDQLVQFITDVAQYYLRFYYLTLSKGSLNNPGIKSIAAINKNEFLKFLLNADNVFKKAIYKNIDSILEKSIYLKLINKIHNLKTNDQLDFDNLLVLLQADEITGTKYPLESERSCQKIIRLKQTITTYQASTHDVIRFFKRTSHPLVEPLKQLKDSLIPYNIIPVSSYEFTSRSVQKKKDETAAENENNSSKNEYSVMQMALTLKFLGEDEQKMQTHSNINKILYANFKENEKFFISSLSSSTGCFFITLVIESDYKAEDWKNIIEKLCLYWENITEKLCLFGFITDSEKRKINEKISSESTNSSTQLINTHLADKNWNQIYLLVMQNFNILNSPVDSKLNTLFLRLIAANQFNLIMLTAEYADLTLVNSSRNGWLHTAIRENAYASLKTLLELGYGRRKQEWETQNLSGDSSLDLAIKFYKQGNPNALYNYVQYVGIPPLIFVDAYELSSLAASFSNRTLSTRGVLKILGLYSDKLLNANKDDDPRLMILKGRLCDLAKIEAQKKSSNVVYVTFSESLKLLSEIRNYDLPDDIFDEFYSSDVISSFTNCETYPQDLISVFIDVLNNKTDDDAKNINQISYTFSNLCSFYLQNNSSNQDVRFLIELFIYCGAYLPNTTNVESTFKDIELFTSPLYKLNTLYFVSATATHGQDRSDFVTLSNMFQQISKFCEQLIAENDISDTEIMKIALHNKALEVMVEAAKEMQESNYLSIIVKAISSLETSLPQVKPPGLN